MMHNKVVLILTIYGLLGHVMMAEDKNTGPAAYHGLSDMNEGKRLSESRDNLGWGEGGGMGFGSGGGMGFGGGGGGGSGGGLGFSNERLFQAYIALQAWKKAITDDPLGITNTWVGKDVCSYIGVFCAPPLDKSCDEVVAGIDLNHGFLEGILVEELGMLTDIALFHINSNRFSGSIPFGFSHLRLLAELDVSNNQLSGFFPSVVLAMPSLIYLDLRFNQLKGPIPADLFYKKLDAIFLNNNYFEDKIPANLGNSPVSVVTFANNKLSGAIPPSIGNMAQSLNEVLFLNNQLYGCLPEETGMLNQVTVLDLSFNTLGGQVPMSLGCLCNIEQLVLSHNEFYASIPDAICSVESLKNLSVSHNYFTGEGASCPLLPSRGVAFDDTQNCIPGRPFQRSPAECAAFGGKSKTCPEMPFPHLQCVLPPNPQPVVSPIPPPPLRYSPPPISPVPAVRYASPPPPPPIIPVPAVRYASPPPPPPIFPVPAVRYASPPTPSDPPCAALPMH